MTGPEFSVIIPTFGRPESLAAAIRSVLEQTVEDLECIIVDDAGPEVPDVPDDPRIRLIRREVNGGPGAARNTGMDAALGEYVAFLDDDDLWRDDFLAIAQAALIEGSVSVCWSRYIDEPATPWRVLEGDVSQHILDALPPSVGATVVPAFAAPRFDERYPACEDHDWWLRLSERLSVETTPEFAHLVRRHGMGMSKGRATPRIDGGVMLLETHERYFAAHPKAASFRLFRMGLTAAQSGDRLTAVRYLARALRRDPSLRLAAHLVTVPIRRW